MKKLTLSLLIMFVASGVLAGSSFSGKLGVHLEILPTNGCSNGRCTVNSSKVLTDVMQGKPAKDFKATLKGNLMTIEF